MLYISSLIDYEIGEKCVCTTNDRFWKRPEDVEVKIQTMTQKAGQKLVAQAYIKKYFKTLQQNTDESQKKLNNNQI